MRYASILVLLAGFWLLLSGHYTPLILSLGAVSVALVTWFLWRMDRVDGEPSSLWPGPRMLGYFGYLLVCVVKANIDLARRILDPTLPVSPVWERLDTRVSSPMEKTLYANSITLTPGTLTTDVRDDHFLIHALNAEGVEELREGEMERRILRLGI